MSSIGTYASLTVSCPSGSLNRGTARSRLTTGRELALADYIEACELDSELGCQNKKILQDDGVVASDPSRVAAKGPSSTTSTSGSVRSGRAMGATTQVTAAAGTVHVPASMKSGKDDL